MADKTYDIKARGGASFVVPPGHQSSLVKGTCEEFGLPSFVNSTSPAPAVIRVDNIGLSVKDFEEALRRIATHDR